MTNHPSAVPPGRGRTDLADYYKALLESVDKTIRELDKTIVSLASATLALSATFVKDIGTNRLSAVRGSWGLLVGSIVATFVGWAMSAFLTQRALGLAAQGRLVDETYRRRSNFAVYIVTGIAVTLFIGGLVLLALFAIANLEDSP